VISVLVQKNRAPLLGKGFKTEGAFGPTKALLLGILADAFLEGLIGGKLARVDPRLAGDERLMPFGQRAELFPFQPGAAVEEASAVRAETVRRRLQTIPLPDRPSREKACWPTGLPTCPPAAHRKGILLIMMHLRLAQEFRIEL